MSAPWTMAQQRMYRQQVAQLAGIMPFDDENRRALLHQVTGKSSTAEINGEEMRRVIDEQRRLLRKCGVRQPRTEASPGMTQEEYIEHLAEKLGWEGQPERLAGMLRRQFQGRSTLEQLSHQERSRFVAALKALVRDQRNGRMAAERPLEARPAPRPDWQPQVIRGGGR